MRSPAFMNIQLFAEPGAGAPTPTPAPTPAPAPITPPVATPPVATPPVATPPVVSQASYTELEKNFKALTDSYKASLGEKERKVFEDNEKDKLIAELQREKRVIEYGSKLSSLELDENTLRVVTEDMMKGEVGTLIKAVSAFIEKKAKEAKDKAANDTPAPPDGQGTKPSTPGNEFEKYRDNPELFYKSALGTK